MNLGIQLRSYGADANFFGLVSCVVVLSSGCGLHEPMIESVGQPRKVASANPRCGNHSPAYLAARTYLESTIESDLKPQLLHYRNYFYHTVEHSLGVGNGAAEILREAGASEPEILATQFAGYYHDYYNDAPDVPEARGYPDTISGQDYIGYFNNRSVKVDEQSNEKRSAVKLETLLRAANPIEGPPVFSDALIARVVAAVQATQVVGVDANLGLIRRIDDDDPIEEALAIADLKHTLADDFRTHFIEALSVWFEDRIDVQHYFYTPKVGKSERDALRELNPSCFALWEARYRKGLDDLFKFQVVLAIGQIRRVQRLILEQKPNNQFVKAITELYPSVANDDGIVALNAFAVSLQEQDWSVSQQWDLDNMIDVFKPQGIAVFDLPKPIAPRVCPN